MLADALLDSVTFNREPDNRRDVESNEPEIQNNELERHLSHRKQPCYAPECCIALMELINTCWSHRPSKRPTFESIVNELEDISKKLGATAHGSNGEGEFTEI